jgi:hypothetical protein
VLPTCEWVKSFTREDGTFVQSHWSSKAGYAGECPLLAPEPLPQPHENLPIYEGPRGGRYHISPKSGRKVYEH